MRIVDIRETAIPLKSTLRNAVFDFSEMTASVVAVITDVMRDGNLFHNAARGCVREQHARCLSISPVFCAAAD